MSSGGVLRIYSESCVLRCHLGQFVNPGYPVGTKSETCGRVKDNAPHENRTDTIVSFWITAPELLRLPGLDLTRAAWRSVRIGSLVVYFAKRVGTLSPNNTL